MGVQIVSYVFIYLSLRIFSKKFNSVFITSYLLGVLFSLYVNVTVMMSLTWRYTSNHRSLAKYLFYIITGYC